MNIVLALLSFFWGNTGITVPHTSPASPPPDSLEAVVHLQRSSVLYIGLDNHLEILANGINANNLELTTNNPNCTIRKGVDGNYVVHCRRAGLALFTVSNPKTGQQARYRYGIKRIPDPIVQLGKHSESRTLSVGEFKAQPGLIARVTGMEMDAQCQLLAFTLFYQSQNNDPIQMRNESGRFQGRVRNAIQAARSGDRYVFTEVMVRCPGDPAGRRLSGLTFTIR